MYALTARQSAEKSVSTRPGRLYERRDYHGKQVWEGTCSGSPEDLWGGQMKVSADGCGLKIAMRACSLLWNLVNQGPVVIDEVEAEKSRSSWET